MQDKKIIDCFNLSVPLELFEEAGIEPDGIIEMSVQNGRIVINNPDTNNDLLCDEDCGCCPIERARCSNIRRLNVRRKKK